MYSIIYWANNDDEVYPVITSDGQIKLFDSIKEADKHAETINNSRVISLEEIHE